MLLILSLDFDSSNALPVMQNILMDRFLDNLTQEPYNKAYIIQGTPNVCEWIGLACTEGKLTGIFYDTYAFATNLQLEYAPPDIEDIYIVSCKQRFPVHTRRLPRCLESLNLCDNSIFGTFDFTKLPANIVDVRISSNKIEGPINLEHLPVSLHWLYATNNKIDQHAVHVQKHGLGKLMLNLDGNSIREMCVVRPNGELTRLKMRRANLQADVEGELTIN